MTGTAVVRSPTVPVTEELVSTLVRTGGYTHPLFQGVGAPVMGQGLLLLAGGLAEQSGALDHVVALVGFESVRFRAMARPGARVTLIQELLASTPTSDGRHLARYAWTAVDQSGTVLLEAIALMLTQPPEGSPAP